MQQYLQWAAVSDILSGMHRAVQRYSFIVHNQYFKVLAIPAYNYFNVQCTVQYEYITTRIPRVRVVQTKINGAVYS